ncbi:MAG: GTP cyclohydrolase I FolE [Myxococcaceae bacterium]|nr:GTP cyclohydrolase I FolE [Myxococcaceae bacterium]
MPAKKPDRARMERAVADFLDAMGLDRNDPNLKATPERVAEAWLEEFIDGYAKKPDEQLGERFPAGKTSKRQLVVVTQLRFHSMCPHHLLPYTGTAHLAYLPGREVVGFGRLNAILETFAHRLTLQEEIARNVARALAQSLKSPATACILQAEQTCLRLRGGHQRDAVTHAEAYEGLLKRDAGLRSELWARIAGGSRS